MVSHSHSFCSALISLLFEMILTGPELRNHKKALKYIDIPISPGNPEMGAKEHFEWL